MKNRSIYSVLVFAAFVCLFHNGITAQTNAFNYQGSLNNAGSPANGNFDFEFALFDAAGAGAQLGSTLTRSNVAVANGVFSVSLDFGSQFPGSNRFLEIRVRQAGGGGFTTLAPRQQIDSSPYSIKSLTADTAANATSAANATNATNAATATNALQLGGVAANQYIQSGTAIINAATQFNINGNRVLSVPGTNTFLGSSTGALSGIGNSFFGNSAGGNTSTGDFNSFFGTGAGDSNTSGRRNSFFGNRAGDANTTGFDNSFFGDSAGAANTTGSSNSFFGTSAGVGNTGAFNSFFGFEAGMSNTASSNTFFGGRAGRNNTTGFNNAFFGVNAGFSTTTGLQNSFFGTGAGSANVTGNDNSFFGFLSGDNNTTGSSNAFFGRGAGAANTTAGNNSFFGNFAGQLNTTGNSNAFFGSFAGGNTTTGNQNSFFGQAAGFSNTTANGNSYFGTSAGFSNTTGEGNSAFGNFAGRAGGSQNSFFGFQAGKVSTLFNNSFFGFNAGVANDAGVANSFFGHEAGLSTTDGDSNAFFGKSAGTANTSGNNNAFFGTNSGQATTNGDGNAFFGDSAGSANTTGNNNAYFGRQAGLGNITGSSNSFVGAFTGSAAGLSNATAVGNRAFVSQSNSLVLGSINAVNGSTADTNVGIGTSSPTSLLTIGEPEATIVSGRVSIFSPSGFNLLLRETTNNVEAVVGVNGGSGVILGSMSDTPVRIRTNNVNRLTIDGSGNAIFSGIVSMNSFTAVTLDSGGSTAICRNASDRLATCSSSARYKSNINPFYSGIDLLKRLRPVSFNWSEGGMLDLGLVAEEVAKVEPLLTTTNDKGQIEGVKYDRVGVVLINAVKEQQAQIEQQKKEIDSLKSTVREQNERLEALTRAVCASQPTATVCKP